MLQPCFVLPTNPLVIILHKNDLHHSAFHSSDVLLYLLVVRPFSVCFKVGDFDITVYTSNKLGAGTDANVYIKLFGTQFNEETASSPTQLDGGFEKNW
jgi:hypothetical protein